MFEELKDRLQKAETASEEYQRQLIMLQTRLDESIHERGKLDDSVHESEGRMHDLEDENVRLIRQKREIETAFESERIAMVRDKTEQKVRGRSFRSSLYPFSITNDSYCDDYLRAEMLTPKLNTEEDLLSVIQRLKTVQKEQRVNGDENREISVNRKFASRSPNQGANI